MPETPIPNEFDRPKGWHFAFEGVNLRDVPDAIKPTKYASAKNIRATATQAIQTRPGYSPLFSTGGNAVTDIGVYATLSTDDLPRFLVRDSVNGIYLDNGSLVTTMLGAAGQGAWLLPFRPNESPQTWMYTASQEDYQKLSAPSSTNVVTAYTVGIKEPPFQCEAAAIGTSYVIITGLAANWTPGGVMAAPSDSNRAIDTAGFVLTDPIISTRRYVVSFAGTLAPFLPGELVTFAGGPLTLVEDVFPAAPSLTVQAILDIGAVPGLPAIPGLTLIQVEQAPISSGVDELLGALRRGSVVQFDRTLEYAVVLDTITGPTGSLAIELVVTGTYLPGDTLHGVKDMQVDYSAAAFGQAILGPDIISGMSAAGVGTLTQAFTNPPFATATGVGYPQLDDYFHISLKVDNPINLTEIQIRFGKNSVFTTDYFYYAVQPSEFAAVVTNAQTQLDAELSSLSQSTLPPGTPLPAQTPAGFSSWMELLIPINSFIRVGEDVGLTLENCNSMQLVVNAASTPISLFQFSSIWIGRGGQPDVGQDGADYRYRVVPRNSTTGVRGNPSPPMYYGVRPRRQQVQVNIPDLSYDPQIDTVDVYRYGGSVTSYRYIGSTDSSQTSFIDNFTDQAALGGSALEVDNFEPWPSVDVPFRVTVGGGVTAQVCGSLLRLSGVTPWPSTIDRWLPGTLVQLGGHTAYTIRSRPLPLSSTAYIFSFEECIENDAISGILYVSILEPKVAKNPNPYIFGPDVNGTFFGVGDKFRPGTVSFSKINVPDSVPDRYNLDLCPPSEPLIGGVIKAGVSMVASTQRWWALYPNFGTARRYNPIEQPVGRGLIAPYAVCTDGVFIYFWMKDGIGMTSGGPYISLTDEDLYPIFPHEGVSGVNITRFGFTYYAPDYGRVGTFRLRRSKTYLYADYQDTGGNPRTLVCDLRFRGWSQDEYAHQMVCHVATEQQSGPLISSGNSYTSLVMGDRLGKVWKEVDCAGDNSNRIPCHVGTFEWDGGDPRMQPLFGDSYLDCLPNNNITVTPISLGRSIAPATVISANNSRQFVPISVDGGQLQKYLGLLLEWSD